MHSHTPLTTLDAFHLRRQVQIDPLHCIAVGGSRLGGGAELLTFLQETQIQQPSVRVQTSKHSR